MGRENETTTKYKVDISELVKGMQTAKRQIAMANAEFKKQIAGLDDWSKSADGVSAKLTQLDKTFNSQKSVLANLEKQYELTVQQMGEDSKEAENLKIKIDNQKASMAKTEKQIRQYTDSLAEIKSQSNQSETALDKLSRTISEQEQELSDLKTAYANTVLEYGKSSKKAKSLADQIDILSSDLADNKKEMDKAGKAADELDNSLDDSADGAKNASGGFTVLKGALADLVADGIRTAVDGFKELISSSDQASNRFQAATGVTAEAMEKYNDVIENIYKNNFGDSLEDVAEKMAKVKEITGELDASKLQKMTEAGITLEDTFGMDMTETLRGVQSLMDHFGMSADEAFDLMASGAQNGLNYTDELGDNVSEYAGKFAEAGYSAEEYFQLLKNGSEGGAYNLDKVNDAINEVTTRLADGTIEESLGMFSAETADVFKMWQEGRATQSDVISEIIADIDDATTEQEKMNLAAKAFGTMAEDGGVKFIQSLSTVGHSFDQTKGKMDEIKQMRYDDVMSQLSGLGRTVKMDLIAPFVNELLPYLKEGVSYVVGKMPDITNSIKPAVQAVGEFIGWIIDNKDLVIAGITGIATALLAWDVVTMIQGIVGAVKAFQLANEGATVAQMALNLAMSLNPIGIIISLVTALVAAFIVLWNKSEAFRTFWINLWDAIVSTVSTVVTAISDFFSGLWDSIVAIWSTVSEWFNTCVIQPIVGFFSGLWTTVSGFFSQLWTDIVAIFTPAVEWFTELFTSIWGTMSSVINVIVGLVQGCWAMICRVFEVAGEWFGTNVIQPIADFFKTLWNGLSSGANAVWEAISGVFSIVADWFNKTLIQPVSKFFSDMWNKLKSGAANAWAGIKSVFSSVATFFGDVFGKAWNAVKKVFSTGGKIFDGIKEGITNAFKAVVNAIIKGINKVVSIPFKAINKVLDKIRNISFLGISPFKGLFGDISIPEIPLLYRGGVLKKGQVGYLEGNGDEAVVPLEKNTGWLDKVAQRIVDKGGTTGAQAQTINNNYNYEYNQTNNSPKALNRLEIYRQTRNQFNYATGGAV